MIYYISDLHFGCSNLFEGRDENTDKFIQERWNSKVTNADDVYILGDIGKFGNTKDNMKLCQQLAILKGNKHLIVGNHDDLRDLRIKQLFCEICDYKEIVDPYCDNKKVILSHYPILSWNGAYSRKNSSILLYGHVHNNFDEEVFQSSLVSLRDAVERQGRDMGFPYAYNVGCMMPRMGYEPKTLKEILKHKISLTS